MKPDDDSGIVNDPNAWAPETAQNPRYILDLVKRAVRVSLDTQALIRELPSLGLDDAVQS